VFKTWVALTREYEALNLKVAHSFQGMAFFKNKYTSLREKKCRIFFAVF